METPDTPVQEVAVNVQVAQPAVPQDDSPSPATPSKWLPNRPPPPQNQCSRQSLLKRRARRPVRQSGQGKAVAQLVQCAAQTAAC